VLAPSDDGLSAIAAAADRDGLAGVQAVITRRLESAPGEELRVSWTPPFFGGAMRITDPVVDDYLLGHCTPTDGVLGELVAETREATGGASTMQVSSDEGALLTMLTRMVNARFAVEVEVFTGYSSICIARGLAPGGRLLACDTSEVWTAMPRRRHRAGQRAAGRPRPRPGLPGGTPSGDAPPQRSHRRRRAGRGGHADRARRPHARAQTLTRAAPRRSGRR
jgi:hypothetical protein